MHKSQIRTLVIDCPEQTWNQATQFWSQFLGFAPNTAVEPSDNYLALEGSLEKIRVLLQKVAGPAEIHLDLETDDTDAELTRVTAIGAREKYPVKYWRVMETPSGHTFCILPAEKETGLTQHAQTWDASQN